MDPDQLEDVKLDEAVAHEIFKYEILGETKCWYCEGSWHVQPGDRASSDSVIRPVHISPYGCNCQDKEVIKIREEEEIKYYKNESPEDKKRRYEREFFAGHEVHCLTAVEEYHEWIKYAFFIIEKLKPCSFSLHYLDDEWIAEMHDAVAHHEARVKGGPGDEVAAATALCRVGIKAARAGKIPRC
jgi:hypothetical protein